MSARHAHMEGILMLQTQRYFRCFLLAVMIVAPLSGSAQWNFSGGDNPNAFIQSGDMTLEFNCGGMRFAPAGWEDAQDIERKQGLSIRFMSNGSTESGSFQAGGDNASIRIVDNYPVEVRFSEQADYDFVLQQIADNAVLNLSMVDEDVSYGIFDLGGSAAAIGQLRAACGWGGTAGGGMEAPEGIVYCGGGGIQRQIEYVIDDNASDQWDARVTVNGETRRAMTSYSYFGSNQPAPEGFVVALLAEDRAEFLVFSRGGEQWIEFGDYAYYPCN